MKKLSLIFGLSLLASGSVSASPVYVDCRTDIAAPDGSQAKPYSSLQSAIDSLIQVGGVIQVASGVCTGPVHVTGLQAPLTINGASDGSSILSGSTKLAGWVVHSGTIYKKVVGNHIGQVFLNGNFFKKARYPQTTFLSTGAATTNTSGTLQISASDLAALKGKDLSNATLTLRIVDYWYNSVVVGSMDQTTGLMSLNTNPSQISECDPGCKFTYGVQPGWGYFLENKLWMMTPGSWVYDAPTHTVYVQMADGSNPNNANLEVADDTDLFKVDSSSNVTVSKLHFQNSGKSGVMFYNSSNLTLDGVKINNIHRMGVIADGLTMPWKLTNSMMDNIGSNGVYQNSPNLNQPVLIKNTRFSNIGTPLGPRYITGAVHFFSATPSKVEVSYNSFNNIAYIGILGSWQSRILGNIVQNFCQLADDCGGIYAGGRGLGTVIKNNVVSVATANTLGKPAARGPYAVAGIYLDDHASLMSVTGNKVEKVDLGMMLHNAHDNVIESNSLYDYKDFGIRSQEDDVRKAFDFTTGRFVAVLDSNGLTFPSTNNNSLNDNVLGTKTHGVPLLVTSRQGTGLDRIRAAFSGRGNLFVNPLNFNYLKFPNSAGVKDFLFDELPTLGVDSVPRRPFDTVLAPYSTVNEVTTLNAGTAAELAKFSLWSAHGTLSKSQVACPLPSWSGICLSYTSGNEKSVMISPAFPVTLGTFYRVKVQIKSGNSKAGLLPIALYGPSYENIDALNTQKFIRAGNESNQWTQYEFYFKANETVQNAIVDFEVPLASNVILGGFEVKAVTVADQDLGQYFQYSINQSTTAPLQVNCPYAGTCGSWRDTEGFQAFYPYYVQPRGTVVTWRDPLQSITQLEPELGLVSRVELESAPLTIINDPKTLGAIFAGAFTLASGGRGIYAVDNGDEFSFPIQITRTGVYHLALRVRTGNSNANSNDMISFLRTKNNYRMYVDGVAPQLIADLDGISGVDPSGGGTYWGNIYTPNVNLTQGTHTIRLRMNSNYQFLDVLEVLTGDVPFPANSMVVTDPL